MVEFVSIRNLHGCEPAQPTLPASLYSREFIVAGDKRNGIITLCTDGDRRCAFRKKQQRGFVLMFIEHLVYFTAAYGGTS